MNKIVKEHINHHFTKLYEQSQINILALQDETTMHKLNQSLHQHLKISDIQNNVPL